MDGLRGTQERVLPETARRETAPTEVRQRCPDMPAPTRSDGELWPTFEIAFSILYTGTTYYVAEKCVRGRRRLD